MAYKANVDMVWNKPFSQVIRETTGGDKTQLFMANEVRRLCDPYVPANNMMLSRNVHIGVEGGKGYVHYLSPYARFQYEGKVMVGVKTGSAWAKRNEHKVVTSENLHYETFRHPLATSHWDKAMKVAHADDLAKSLQNYIRK